MRKLLIIFIISSTTTFSNAQKFDDLYNNAQVNLDTGNYILAIKFYGLALKKNSKHANSYFNRGLAYSMLDSNTLAINDFTLYISFVHDDVDDYSQRA